MGWEISKSFDFCFGHRVHNQMLNAEYSLDSCTACRHLHGHQGTVVVTLSSEELRNGMVTDFKHLNWFKKWLDEVLDHKFIMDINDPLLVHEIPHLFDGHRDLKRHFLKFHGSNYYTLLLEKFEVLKYDPVLAEKYEGMVLVNFVPTSENLSNWLFDVLKDKMRKIEGVIIVKKVEFYETPKSKSVYAG